MQRKSRSICAAVAVALVASSSASAVEIYWQGGAGNLTDANYTDGATPNLAPAAGDILNLGSGGTVGNAVDASAIALRVGHGQATLPGTGTLDLTAGTLTVAGTTLVSTSPNPAGAAIIGSGTAGTLNVNGGSLTVSVGPTFVGYAAGGNGTLNLSAGTVTFTNNRLGIGEGGAGAVIVSGGTLKTLGAGTSPNGDMIVGVNTTSSFSQTGGTVSLQRDLIVGRRTADASTFSMTGGSFTARDLSLADDGTPGDATTSDTADNVSFAASGGSLALRGAFIGRNLASGTNFTISDDPGIAGTTTVTTTGEMQIGFNAATNTTATISGGTVTVGNNLLIADGTANGTTLNVSGGAVTIGTSDTSGGTFDLGRGGSNNTTFNLSGGSVTVVAGVDTNNNPAEGLFNLANQTGAASVPAPVNVLANHTGGTLNARGVVVGDNLGGSTTPGSNNATYSLSGTGVINAGFTIIGRRLQGTMNQTGGTANLGTLSVGFNEGASTDPKATGLYNISGGALNANSIALAPNGTNSLPAGTGTLKVFGDDATISLTGNFSSTSSGTLAFGFETGDLLTLVNVGGTATFDAGSMLLLDSSLAAPTQTSYDLLTATTITDSGIVFSGPAGWSLQIVPGLNGQILRAVQAAAGGTLYWDIDGATAGSGGATPSGNWDGTTANFTSDAAGSSGTTTAATTANDDVVFAAGTDSTGSYTVTVSGTQSAKSVQVARGSVTFTGGAISTPTVDVSAGATAAVNSTLSQNLTKTGAGALALGAANTMASTTVSAGTLVAAHGDAFGGGAVNVADGALAQAQPGLTKAVTVSTLNTNTSGKFDVTNNSMVVKGMTDAQVRTQLQAGYNGGAWNGATGIVSSAVNSSTSVGYASNTSLGLTEFKGVSGLTGSDVIVKYTYAGDANLDGKVDIGDLGLLAGAWQQLTGKVWFDGDFTYDGAVNIGDLGLLAGNWQKGTAGNPSGPLVDFNTALAQFSAFDGVVVPEPASLSLLALGGLAALGRRRRRGA